MLERTAAGLESCSLQRVVSKPAKRCRRLHTGFWQHGASAIDLSSVWPGLLRDNESEAAEENPVSRQLQSGLIASAFLLDFLYPSSTLPLLRRIYPSLPRAQDGQSTNVSSSRRSYNSAATTTIVEPMSSEESFLGSSGSYHGRTEQQFQSSASWNDQARIKHFDESHLDNSTPSSILDVPLHARKSEQGSLDLQKLLKDSKGKLYADVWDLYLHLDHEDRAPVRGDVLQYLARSSGFVETGRAASVFRQIPVDEWTHGIMAAGVNVTLRASDLAHALKVFYTGLEAKGLSGGLEPIMVKAILSRHWDTVLRAWVGYYTVESKKTRNHAMDTTPLKLLETIFGLGPLYFAFRSYLATHGKQYYEKLQEDHISGEALQAFDRYFARQALWEPCTPEQAATILEYKKDPGLYNLYLHRMFDRWYEKLESRAQVVKLPKIYQSYRELPTARPSRSVLRGMFKIYFPDGIAQLDQIYQDWVRFYGGLNQWGFEKFLKLAAHRGDVQTVQRLWKQFVAEFPEMLETPRGFRSALNVYAQTGDVAGLEQEFETMTKKYNVKPDISCWNVMLKAYVRANNYDGTLKCFDRICAHEKPDHFTYAHVMAMASKKGDLETTLAFFRRSQAAQIPLSTEMSLALVVVYCLNDLLFEAEALCMELASRKLTDATIWNQLINHYGLRGDLNKCNELVARMEKYGIEPDNETYGFLLQPLLKTNRIQDAFGLLTKGESQGLFTVTPEHYAAIMVGAARVGQHHLVETLYKRLQERQLPPTFSALVALVDNAVKRKPGVERTRNLSHEFIARFREAVDATKAGKQEAGLGLSTQNINELKQGTSALGRAVMLLVQLREFASLEELMTLYTELSPQTTKGGGFPVDVVSALMLAYYDDMKYEEVIKLWEATWLQVSKTWLKPDVKEVYARHEYDLSRIIPVLFRSFRKLGDGSGCADCVDKLHAAGFKLTNSGWISAITGLAKTGEWERAMYYCETILMPGWRGWASKAADLKKMRIRSTLKPSKHLVTVLSSGWLKLRRMAAWSSEASRALQDVDSKYPRLVIAFNRMEFSEKRRVEEDIHESPSKDLDNMLKTLSYGELKKIKQVLLRQLMQEWKNQKKLGLSRDVKSPKERELWKRALHNKIRRYALRWAERRAALREGSTYKKVASMVELTKEMEDIPEEVDAKLEDSDSAEVEERKGYWDDYWRRYDQKPPKKGSRAFSSQKKPRRPRKKESNQH